ncbi:MAG: hypothetical protein ACTS7D_01805, partial [Candidatus Hodgkinia cicadicola]
MITLLSILNSFRPNFACSEVVLNHFASAFLSLRNSRTLMTKSSSEMVQPNFNYFPIWNINKLGNYLQDFISIAKLTGYRGVLLKV